MNNADLLAWPVPADKLSTVNYVRNVRMPRQLQERSLGARGVLSSFLIGTVPNLTRDKDSQSIVKICKSRSS
jgi:hypothetical protein